MSTTKAVQVVAYLWRGCQPIGAVALGELVYLAERRSLIETGRRFTELPFSLVKGHLQVDLSDVNLNETEVDHLSIYETRILEDVLTGFAKIAGKPHLMSALRGLPELAAHEGPIDPAHILRANGWLEADVTNAQADWEAHAWFQRIIDGATDGC